MSCQPRPQPQATGMAAISARNGTATKTPTRTRSKVLLGSASISGRVRAGPGAGGVMTVPGTSARSVVAVIGVPRSAGGDDQGASAFAYTGFKGRCKYAYVTVAYATVGYTSVRWTFRKFVTKITAPGLARMRVISAP